MKSHVIIGDLEIFIDGSKNRIIVSKTSLSSALDIPEIEKIGLFSGSISQFEDFLSKMKRKYGHLYGQ